MNKFEFETVRSLANTRLESDQLLLEFALTHFQADVKPALLAISVVVQFAHPTGVFAYMSNDLPYYPDAFSEFAKELRQIEDRSKFASLGSLGDAFQFSAQRCESLTQLKISIKEFQGLGIENATLSGSLYLPNLNIFSWANSLELFSDQVLEQMPA